VGDTSVGKGMGEVCLDLTFVPLFFLSYFMFEPLFFLSSFAPALPLLARTLGDRLTREAEPALSSEEKIYK
jgi:ABC-type protease/lipase transport system fused ATPase/permease subunit